MITQFQDGQPGTPATFEGVLHSLNDELHAAFLPFPEQWVELTDNEDFTVDDSTPPSIIKAGQNSTVTFTGAVTAKRCHAVVGELFNVTANGVTQSHKNNAVLVIAPEAGTLFRATAASSAEIDMLRADLPVTAAPDPSLSTRAAAASLWLHQEARRQAKQKSMGLRGCYAYQLDYDSVDKITNTDVSLATKSFQYTVPADATICRIKVTSASPNPVLNFSLSEFVPFNAQSFENNTLSVTITIDAVESNANNRMTFTIPNNLSWAPGASPNEVMKSPNGVRIKYCPVFHIEQIDDELFFRPQILSPV